MSYELTIEYGDDVLLSTGLSRSEFDHEVALLLAGKLYETRPAEFGPSGQAVWQGPSRLSPLPTRIGISISNLRPEDAEPELRFLQSA